MDRVRCSQLGYPRGPVALLAYGVVVRCRASELIPPRWALIAPLDLDVHGTSNYYRTRPPAPSRGPELQLPAVEPQLKYGGDNFDEAEWSIARNTVHHAACVASASDSPSRPSSAAAWRPSHRSSQALKK